MRSCLLALTTAALALVVLLLHAGWLVFHPPAWFG